MGIPIVRRSRTGTDDYGVAVLLSWGSDWRYVCLLPRPVVEQVSFVRSEHLVEPRPHSIGVAHAVYGGCVEEACTSPPNCSGTLHQAGPCTTTALPKFKRRQSRFCSIATRQAPGFCQLFPPFLPDPKPRSFPDHGSTTDTSRP